MTDKPPLPAKLLDPWERATVDTTEGGDYWKIRRIAIQATTAWALGPDGPFQTRQSLVDIVNGSVNEALTHLLELGLIDIDTARLHAAKIYPMSRKD
jgi:hypothetical protein